MNTIACRALGGGSFKMTKDREKKSMWEEASELRSIIACRALGGDVFKMT